MDELVRQAMVKWPNVPDCLGWLGLDSRGQWYMRDDRVQSLGSFQSSIQGAKGSLLKHEKLIGFIERNYEGDDKGRWFFQNGPQRVYIELEATPYIWRLDQSFVPVSHTGRVTQALSCLLDEQGRVYLKTPLGLGLVHTMDMGWVAEAIERGIWTVEDCLSADLPAQHGYVMSPQQSTSSEDIKKPTTRSAF